jgi:HAD superfamily hydrolase (TIGR01509 family)
MANRDIKPWSVVGRVVTGVGQGAGFSQLDWAKKQFMSLCGIDPYPGTLNIILEDAENLAAWRTMKSQPGHPVRSEDPAACDATLYPVRLRDAIPGVVILPDVAGYADEQVEVVAAVSLREQLDLHDGDQLEIAGEVARPVNAVIFDVDGTLLNSLEGYRIAASRATAPYGYEVTYEAVRQSLNLNQPFWDFIIPAGQPRDPAFIAKLRDETMRHWPAVRDAHVRTLPGLTGVLERLANAGVRLGIFTGSDGESLPCLEKAGLLDQFEVIVTRRDVEKFKPDPAGLIECMKRMGVTAQKTVYVGDSRNDVQASLAAGVMSIAVLSGAGDSASLSAAGAHRLLAEIASLPDLLNIA